MRKIIQIIIIYICFVNTTQAADQVGFVKDGAGQAIDYATVILLSMSGHLPVATAVSDSVGKFNLSVPTGTYLMKIRHIGYKAIENVINVEAGKTIGTFILESETVDLKELEISASAITREADRFIMRVGNTPMLSNKSTAELLRLAPGVWVAENGISINGANGCKVFINEREIKLTGSELVNYLKNYRSENISKIEIIPQAGSEYSADTQGGIVKITLRKGTEKGVLGNFSFETRQGEFLNYYQTGVNVNASINRWSINALMNGSLSPNAQNVMTANRQYKTTTDNYFSSKSFMNYKTRSGTGRLAIIFDPDKWNNLGVEVEYGQADTPNPSSAQTHIVQDGKTIVGSSAYRQNENKVNFSGVFNFIHKLDTIGSTAKFLADYTQKTISGHNDYSSVFEVYGYTTTDSVYRSNSSAVYKLFTADATINKIFTKRLKYSVGLRYSYNRINDSVRYESYNLNRWKSLEPYNFMLDYRENIYASYANFSFTGRRLSITAGVRGEYSFIRNSGEDSNRSYFDLFPNITANYSFNAMRTFMLIAQYSQNIQRPNFRYLNPNRVQSSDFSYSIGNPALRPTYIKNLGITGVYKYRYTLSVGARLHTDLVREVCKTDSVNPRVTYIVPENHYAENHYYIALNTPLKIGRKFNLNSNLIGVRQDIKATETSTVTPHYLYFANLAAGFNLPAKIYLEITCSSTSRLYSANSGINPRNIFNASVKKQWLNNKLNVSFEVNNIFNSKASYFSDISEFKINTSGYEAWNSRYATINVQYSLNKGKTFKKQQIENLNDGEKSRLEK